MHTQGKNIPAAQSEETVLLNVRNQACITHLISPLIQKSSDTCVTSHSKVFMRQYMKEKRTKRQFREKENKKKQQKWKENPEKSRECQR